MDNMQIRAEHHFNFSEDDEAWVTTNRAKIVEFAASEVARSWEWVKYDKDNPPADGRYITADKLLSFPRLAPIDTHSWKKYWDDNVVAYIPHKLPEVK